MRKKKNTQFEILLYTLKKLSLQFLFTVFFGTMFFAHADGDPPPPPPCIPCVLDSKGNTGGGYGAPSDYSFAANNLLSLKVFIEGSWSGSSQITDTITCEIRNAQHPHNIVDSRKILLNENGEGTSIFSKLLPKTSYYIVVKHRNSIETWSSTPISLYQSGNKYDFTTSSSQAFGDNLILKNGKYCIYSGDVNQDGAINENDLSMIDAGDEPALEVTKDKSTLKSDNQKKDNARDDFEIGYFPGDCTGDNLVDASDVAVIANNVFRNVTAITPLSTKKNIDETKDKKNDDEWIRAPKNEGDKNVPGKKEEIKK